MYLFGTLNRREKRLIIILTTANLLITGMLYAGTRSFVTTSAPPQPEATRIASDSGLAAASIAIMTPSEN